jgi:hypothetical protein
VGAAHIIAADANTWTGILVAALGSSALGAIVGGYLTTRLQGRHEREEAWRNRLIHATHDLNGVLVQALTTVGGLLVRVESSEGGRLRTDSGELVPQTATTIEGVRRLVDQARLQLAHLELLVGSDGDVYQEALGTIIALDYTSNLLQGYPGIQEVLRAVLADREAPGEGQELPGTDQYVFEMLRSRPDAPQTFDPSDDMNVSLWAGELHSAAGGSAHQFMQAAHTYIEAYRLT